MIRHVVMSMSLVVVLASSAVAQLADQTALVGTVTDSSGSVIPGATVVAVNTSTKDTYETTTNAQGYYNIQFLRIGKYEVTVTLSGFQTFKATGIEVATNQVVRRDAALQVGVMSETITVAAGAAMLATENATLVETINERAVEELPLSGRNVWSLAGTTPGVLGGTSSFTGAGQRNIQNSLSMDGINTAANLLTATSMRPISDAVTEVQVQTGSTSAEYGSYLGVHVNVVTKSGTNEAHGSVFEFLQHDSLGARGYFEDRSTPPNPRRRDQFGFQMDGPVFLPKLYDGRNRTFFMTAYEGVREKSTSTSISSVPTALMRQGNFSEVTAAIRNPFTGQPYPGNIDSRVAVLPAGAAGARILSAAEPAGHRVQPRGHRQQCERSGPDSDPHRSEPRQQGTAVRPLQLAGSVRRRHRRDSRRGRRRAEHQLQHARRLYAHALAATAQRFPHRLPRRVRRQLELLRT